MLLFVNSVNLPTAPLEVLLAKEGFRRLIITATRLPELSPFFLLLFQIREQNRFDVMTSGPRSQHLAGIPVDEPRRVRKILHSLFGSVLVLLVSVHQQTKETLGFNEIPSGFFQIVEFVSYLEPLSDWWGLR